MKRDTDTAKWPDEGVSVRETVEPFQPVHAADLILLSGKRGLKSAWILEEFDGFGEDVTQLKRWSETGTEIEGSDLRLALKLTYQIIWGDFMAFDAGGISPWLVITAFDGCCFDVRSSDADVLSSLRNVYIDARPLDPDAPRGAQ